MESNFFILWEGPDFTRHWSGPHDSIDEAKASLPGLEKSSLIVTPLAAMTPGERREALSILPAERTSR